MHIESYTKSFHSKIACFLAKNEAYRIHEIRFAWKYENKYSLY